MDAYNRTCNVEKALTFYSQKFGLAGDIDQLEIFLHKNPCGWSTH